MFNKWSLLLLFSLMVLSCESVHSDKKVKAKLVAKPFLMNLQAFHPNIERNPSFPVWFNDSLIRVHRIKKITRRLMNSTDLNDELKLAKEEYTYTFDKNGKVIEYKMSSFYEGLLYHDVVISYENNEMSKGYNTFEVLSENDFADLGIDHDDIFSKLTLKEATNDYLSFYDENRKRNQYHLLNPKKWGAVSVDTTFTPDDEDIIVFGSPEFPIKRYQVETIVKEKNVMNFHYLGRNLISITHEDYPFLNKRSIVYDLKGKCTGYIDSTFSDNEFLNRKIFSFSLKDNGIPVNIIESSSGKVIVETFEYEYFDENE